MKLIDQKITFLNLVWLMKRKGAELGLPPSFERWNQFGDDLKTGESPCEHCGQNRTYVPFVEIGNPKQYMAAIAYCERCQYAEEF